MKKTLFGQAALASAIAALALTASPAEARTCKRLNKTALDGSAVYGG